MTARVNLVGSLSPWSPPPPRRSLRVGPAWPPSPAARGVDHSYPGARRPDRHRWVDSHGLRLSAWEWGDARRPARCCSPTAASTSPAPSTAWPRCWPTPGGGSWPGTSGATATPTTPPSTRGRPTCATRLAVLATIGRRAGPRRSATARAAPWPSTWPTPAPTGSAAWSTSTASRRPGAGPTSPSTTAPASGPRSWSGWLDHRAAAGSKERRPGTLEELAERRGRMNPRLDAGLAPLRRAHRRPRGRRRLALEDRPLHAHGRLRALAPGVVDVAAPQPGHARALRPGPRAGGHGLGHPARGRGVPPAPRAAASWASRASATSSTSSSPDSGRRPRPGAPRDERTREAPWSSPTTRSASPCTTCATAPTRTSAPCWPSTAWASARPRWPPTGWHRGPDRCGASTSPATAASTPSKGGGYTAEVLLADVDAALAHLGPCTLVGRGLGAYVALLAAGARATAVRGAILLDGPGLAGGGPFPGSPMMLAGVALPPGPARPLRPGRAHPRRPPPGLRRLLRPPGRPALRARHPADGQRRGPPAVAGRRGRCPRRGRGPPPRRPRRLRRHPLTQTARVDTVCQAHCVPLCPPTSRGARPDPWVRRRVRCPGPRPGR